MTRNSFGGRRCDGRGRQRRSSGTGRCSWVRGDRPRVSSSSLSLGAAALPGEGYPMSPSSVRVSSGGHTPASSPPSTGECLRPKALATSWRRRCRPRIAPSASEGARDTTSGIPDAASPPRRRRGRAGTEDDARRAISRRGGRVQGAASTSASPMPSTVSSGWADDVKCRRHRRRRRRPGSHRTPTTGCVASVAPTTSPHTRPSTAWASASVGRSEATAATWTTRRRTAACPPCPRRRT